MAKFLCRGLGVQEVYDSKEMNFPLSREKFFVLDGIWIAVMEGTPPSERSYLTGEFSGIGPQKHLPGRASFECPFSAALNPS